MVMNVRHVLLTVSLVMGQNVLHVLMDFILMVMAVVPVDPSVLSAYLIHNA